MKNLKSLFLLITLYTAFTTNFSYAEIDGKEKKIKKEKTGELKKFLNEKLPSKKASEELIKEIKDAMKKDQQ